ncbi:hypothetical protein AAHC03_016435 [Spirometra sp. Aus1]
MLRQKVERKPKSSRAGEHRSSSKHRTAQKTPAEKSKSKPLTQATHVTDDDKRNTPLSDASLLPRQRISAGHKAVDSNRAEKKTHDSSRDIGFDSQNSKNSNKQSPKPAVSDLPASIAIRDHYGQDWKNTPFDDFQRILAVDYEPKVTAERDSVDANPDPDLHSTNFAAVIGTVKDLSDNLSDKKQNIRRQEPAFGGSNHRAFLSSKPMNGDAEHSGDPGEFIVYSSCNSSTKKEPKINKKAGSTQDSDFGIKWDFSATRAYKHSKRARDLLRLIELGFNEYRDLIDIPPLDEYSSYMLKFGQRDRNQVQTQTNEDMMQKETQTDLLGPSSFVTSWTQSPPDDEGAYAGHECDKPSTMKMASGDEDGELERMFDCIVAESFPDLFTRSQSGDGVQADGLSSLPASTQQRLCDSLNMLLTLLEEEAEADRAGHVARQHHSGPNSEAPSAVGVVQGSLGHLSLSLTPSGTTATAAATIPPVSADKTPNHFAGRRSAFSIPDHCYRDMSDLECVRCEFSKASSRRLLTMHRLKTARPCFIDVSEHALYPCDMICVWAISDASGQGRVERILKCPGLLPMSGRAVEGNLPHEDLLGKGDGVLCVAVECMRGYDVIIGGLSDGSLALWDLASAFTPSFNHDFTRKFHLHCYPEKATATKSPTDVATSNLLPSIFDYAQPPDYLASCVFAASGLSPSSQRSASDNKPSRGGVSKTAATGSSNCAGEQLQHRPSPIISIQVLRTAATPSSSQRDRPLTSFQLCTLDMRGQLIIWLVVTCSSSSQQARPSGTDWGGGKDIAQLAGSVTDFGLRPGGSIRVVQLASILAEGGGDPASLGVGEPLKRRIPPVQVGYEDFAIAATDACWEVCPFTTCLEVCHQTDTFFVGSEDGKVWQRCRVGGRPVYPSFFHLHPETALSVPSPPVTCIALHPTFQDLLLVGYADGHLALYLTHRQSPIFTWQATEGQTRAVGTEGQPDSCPEVEAGGVKKVIWSNHRPTVFYCLTSVGEVAAWILFWRLKQCFNPHAQTLIAAVPSGGADHRVVDFTMVDSVGTGCLAICWSDGAEVHWLEDHLTVLQADELLLLQNVLDQLA